MKDRTHHTPKNSERGAALLAALCFATVLAIALGSYLTLCYRSLQMSSRNVNSGHSVELAESGMEDALWALNKNDWTGWTITGTTATKTITGFTYDNGATGSIALTVASYDGSAGTRTMTVTGTTLLADGTSLARTLTATSAQAPLFVNAVAGTTGKVKFKVAGTVDSYNSSTDLNAASPGYSAIISSGSTSTSSSTVQLVNTQVKGYVATLSTGPSTSSSAKLIGPTTPVGTNIDLNRESTSPYQPLFDEAAPGGTSTLLPSGTATIGTSGATSPTVYSTTDLTLGNGQTLTVNGPVVLIVSGNMYLNYGNSAGTGKIVVSATGSLEIHLAGDLAIDGAGIQNATKLPKNLVILAKADNIYDSLEMGTNTAFYGVIYTPNNALTISNSQTIYGSLVAKSVTFNASPVIHYDLSLRSTVIGGVTTPYAVSNWSETTAP